MDDLDQADQLVNGIQDAIANDRSDQAAALREALLEVNERIVANGYSPIEV